MKKDLRKKLLLGTYYFIIGLYIINAKKFFGGKQVQILAEASNTLTEFEYGSTLENNVDEIYLKDIISLTESNWNEVSTLTTNNLSDEDLQLLQYFNVSYNTTTLEDGSKQYTVFNNPVVFDASAPVTANLELVYDDNTVSALVPMDYELYWVDQSLPFPSMISIEKTNGTVQRFGRIVIPPESSKENYNPFLGGIAVYKPYYRLFETRDSIINKSPKVVLDNHRTCKVPTGYTLYCISGESQSYVKIGQNDSYALYQFLSGVNPNYYVILSNEMAYKIQLIDDIEKIVKQDFYIQLTAGNQKRIKNLPR